MRCLESDRNYYLKKSAVVYNVYVTPSSLNYYSSTFLTTLGPATANMRQLVVVRRICCCSQSMIFLLELLGPAKQPMAGPSSTNRKIVD